METVHVKADKRSDTGKKANKALRSQGKIPAVLYGGADTHIFSTTHNEVKKLIYTPNFKLAELEIDGASHKAIVKEVQFHPVTDAIVHIDFIKLQEGVPVKVNVPVRFKGTSPGVREGGTLIQSMRKVKIKAAPENLVDELIADISEVVLGASIRVKDLEVDDSIQVLSPSNTPVASVNVPRALKSLEEKEAEEAAEATAAEGGEDAAGEEGAVAGDAKE